MQRPCSNRRPLRASGVALLSRSVESYCLGELLHQPLYVPLDKRVSVLKFEIGYEADIAYIEKIIRDPTPREECFHVSVLIGQKW